MEMIPIVLFSDDVSGNESKKWNKLDVWAMMLGGLRKELNSKLENIHFMCASNKVECCELVKPIVEDMIDLEKKGVVMYDSYYEEDVLVVAPMLCTLADNPRASEICSHIGTSARRYCRICNVS